MSHQSDRRRCRQCRTPPAAWRSLKILSDQNVNVEYMYGFVKKFSALLVFRFDDPARAHQVLMAAGVTVIGEKDITGL